MKWISTETALYLEIRIWGFLFCPEDDLDQESDELVRYVTNLEEINQELVLNLLKRIATLEEINS
jgi:hypothetical protein